MNHDEELMTHDEAAKFLRVSDRTLDELFKKPNPPPCFRVGVQRRYMRSQLLAWSEEKRA